jgi:transposase InsO family protein
VVLGHGLNGLGSAGIPTISYSQVVRPNRLWVSDLIDVSLWQGFIYVAFVIDAYARCIIGWKVSRTAHATFVLDALEQAL